MSLRIKVLLPIFLLYAILAGYLYGQYMPRSLANLESAYQSATERHLDSVAEGLIPLLLGRQLDTVYENLDALKKKNSDWIVILLDDTEGRSLYPLTPSQLIPDKDGNAAIRVFKRPIHFLDKDLGSLTVHVDFTPLLAETRHRHLVLIAFILLLISIFALITGFILDRLVIRPVNSLSLASRHLAQGNFDTPLGKSSKDEVGQLVAHFAEMRDAIRGYQAEQQQLTEELKLKNILLSTQQETMLDGILSVDETGKIILYNRRFAEIWSLTDEVLKTKSDELLLRQIRDKVRDSEHFFSKVNHLLERADETSRDEIELNDGRNLDCYSSPMIDPGGRHFGRVWYFRDISENKKLERELRQAQKMEAIGTLAGGIAHDFNNILCTILGNAELSLLDKQLPAKHRKHLTSVFDGAIRASALVKQILTFSRKSDQALQPLQLSLIIKEALKLLRSTLPATVGIKQEINATDAVLADPTQIHQVMMNLCTNAYHAMRENGGTLSVSLDKIEVQAEDTFIAADVAPGNYVRLTVSDTGHGMDKAILEKIFEPYFTTKKQGEGTGLGLAVVHGIVKSHKGRITVYSEPGIGTTFHVYLPVYRGEPTGTGRQQVVADKEQLPTGTERILVVDDELTIVTVYQNMLCMHGYTVFPFTDSRKALDFFTSDPQGVDLLLTDMSMPDINGIELARLVFALRPGLPILLCSGHSDIMNQKKAKAEGISEYLMKPISTPTLLRTIRRTLDNSAESIPKKDLL